MNFQNSKRLKPAIVLKCDSRFFVNFCRMNECAFLHIVKFLFKVTVNNYIFTKSLLSVFFI